MSLLWDDLYEYHAQLGKTLVLNGFKSCTTDETVAKEFALKAQRLNTDQVPVLFIIKYKNPKNMFEVTDDFTYFQSEKEVLLNDGLTYLVKKFSPQQFDKKPFF